MSLYNDPIHSVIVSTDPNSCALYAGISGVTVDVDSFDLGHGVILVKTFAHLMAPFLMAFSPAEPGQPHPPPWRGVSGGLGYDICVQLYVPQSFDPPQWFDRLNTVWWFLALMRLRATPLASVPVISDHPYAGILTSNVKAQFWPVEIGAHRIMPVREPATVLKEDELLWIKKHWLQGGDLMNKSNDFNAAVQAFDSSTNVGKPSVSLMILWGAIEQLFSPSKQELRFRLSATLASYLEPPGNERLLLHKRIMKLYDARSKVAHGAGSAEVDSLIETYDLLRRALIKIIEEQHVPTRDELESLLFGG